MPKVSPPFDVVYGLNDRFEGFIVLDSRIAEAVASEIAALERVDTLGDLRVLCPTLVHVHGPIHPDDDEWPGEPDDTPIDFTMYESWPPHPPYFQVSLPAAVMDELDRIGCIDFWAPMMDAEFYVFRATHETELLAVLNRHGIGARRDDQLIARLGE